MNVKYFSLLLFLSIIPAFGQGAKTAIFVNNLAGQTLEGKAEAFESQLSGLLSGEGYTILSRQTVTESLKEAPELEQDPSQMLATQTSAQRLAQLLGADYILVVNLVSLGAETRNFEGSGIETQNRTVTLRVAYGLLDAAQAGSLTGDTFAVRKTIRNDGSLTINDQDLLNQLMADAAGGVAAQLSAPGVVENLPSPTEQAAPVTFTVTAVLQGIKIPNVMIGPDNQIKVTDTRFPVEAVGVDVILDGVVQGSAPAEFGAMSGLHRLRLTRDGFRAWERNVNLYEGFALTAAMDLTPEGLAQWKEITAFLQELQNDTQLTAAQVKVLEGQAQALRQSGFLVNTTDAPALNLFNSLWGPPFRDGLPVVE